MKITAKNQAESHIEDSQGAASAGFDSENGAKEQPGAGETSPFATVDLEAKVKALEDALLRARAETQNIQRRGAIDRAEAIRYANIELMKSLLNVLDDFERTLRAAESAKELTAIIEGVRLVYANLRKALADHGLEPIEAAGRRFDPTVHEALLQQPSDLVPPGTVIEEAAKGYKLRDRVVRPAKVIVSASKPMA